MIDVSVIIPCYNEQATIRELLQTLYAQDYPSEKMEVIIADGMSTDNTRGIIREFKEKHPDFSVKVIDNLQRIIPAGLNRALEEAQGEYIVRLDAHSSPAADYISRSLQALREGKGDNIGGLLKIEPSAETWIAKSIAVAAGHPLGVGDARYRIGSAAREVDTVAYGTYRSSLIDEIGSYDESLLANEDYEFNVRLRQSGGKVWLDPAIRTTYVARSSLPELGRQYWRYGYWKLRMLLRYPSTFRWRQLSGAFLLSWIVLGVLSIPFSIARWLLLFEAIVYGLALLISGIQTSLRERDWRLMFGVPLAIATMHFSWGAGFLWSLVEYVMGRSGKGDAARKKSVE
ncbi:MAG: glycosyltransferase family 2 protein [Anaerolineales bacterium]